ncbi:MAG: hypothetical protein WD740_01090 [Anaerolineales bacterium]
MNTSQCGVIFLVALSLMLASCSPAAAAPTAVPATAVQATTAPPTSDPASATQPPTQAPSATPWPPVFDINKLGDIRELDSFIVTINLKNTVNGDLTEINTTIGYIREPFSAYAWLDLGTDDTKTYVVGGTVYDVNNFGNWYLSTQANQNLLYQADIPASNTGGLVGAQFAEQVEFEGIPAFHYILDKTDNPPNELNVKSDIEGDFYVAVDGNYVLFSHSMRNTSQGDFHQVYEITQTLSSINQLSEITLPADFLPMEAALALPQDLGLPLPGGSEMTGMIRYNSGGIGVDYYTYSASVSNNDEFLEFYRNLAATDGWTVSHVGKVKVHYECEYSRDCVIINKGSTQVILFYKSYTIGADFDWKHVYSPLN